MQNVDLAEVKFLWGNHDDYLKEPQVTTQAGLPNHLASFIGLNGEIFCEHGHRFDSLNFDNRDSDNTGMNLAYIVPSTRSLEALGRKICGQFDERACYLMGATLIYLYQDYDREENSFSIYIMAHTHAHDLMRFNIQIEPQSLGKKK